MLSPKIYIEIQLYSDAFLTSKELFPFDSASGADRNICKTIISDTKSVEYFKFNF